MIAVPPRILFARRPVDFRKQIDGLAAVCERELGEAPLDGTLFLFTNPRSCTKSSNRADFPGRRATRTACG